MQPFAELTPRGRALRLRRLAIGVLRRDFGLDECRVRLHSIHSFNTMYRVDLAHGQRFILRVGGPHRIHEDGIEAVEAEWLLALARDSAVEVAVPVPNRLGGYVSVGEHHAVPEPRTCSLFTWVDGRPLRDDFDPASAVAMGRLLATLHEHAAGFDGRAPVPPGVVANRAVYFRDAAAIRDQSGKHRSLLAEATDRVQAVLDDLWRSPPHPPHLLHGDFGPQNVLRWRGRLRPVDFQDLQLGFDVQDLGITLADLASTAPGSIEPLKTGYRNVRLWPELPGDLLAALAAARSLNIVNLGLNAPESRLAGYMEEHVQSVADWMRSGP